MGIFGKIGDWAEGIYHDVTGTKNASQKRQEKQLINTQIQAYKDQTELAKNEITRKQGEEQVEKRRIEEKQIRNLRRSNRPSGFMDSGGDLPDKLGS